MNIKEISKANTYMYNNKQELQKKNKYKKQNKISFKELFELECKRLQDK